MEKLSVTASALPASGEGKGAKAVLEAQAATNGMQVQKAIELKGGYPGVECVNADHTKIQRLFLVKEWIYTVDVQSPSGKVDRSIADKVFDSFELK